MIVCGQLQLLHFDTVTNPTVIFEVVFPGTPPFDPGEKYRHYRAIPALRHHVLVMQDAYFVEHYERHADGRWFLSDSCGLGSSVNLSSVSCTLALRDIYAGVDPSAS